MKKLTYKILSDNRTLVMGIAIISIILFHFGQDCLRYNYSYDGVIEWYHKFIGSAGVDIFLLISSFGLYYSFKKNNILIRFYFKRFTRVLIPYLLIATPFIIWFCIYKDLSFLHFIKKITFLNTIFNNDNWYWYILFISFCYLIFPFLFDYIDSSRNGDEVITKVLTLTSVTIVFSLLLFFFHKTLFKSYNIMILRLIPFYFGFIFGYYSYHNKKFELRDYFMILLGLSFLVLSDSKNLIISRLSAFFFVTSFIFILLFIINKIDKYKISKFFRKIIEWFGKHSLEIYLLHVSIRTLFCNYGLYTCKLVYFLIYITIALLLVPIVSFIIDKIQGVLDNKFNSLVK